MPSMSGHEVLVELRRLQPGIKVLIFTGYVTVEGEGAGGIVQKPITVRDLLERIQQVLQG